MDYTSERGKLLFIPPSLYGSLNMEKESASLSSETQTGGANQIIYCVHGQPSGCCATVLSDSNCNQSDGSRTPTTPISIFDDHCHQLRENTGIDKRARRKLILASVLCVIFMLAEVAGGVLSSSLAIATDAAHLLTDFASFMISLFALWVGNRPATKTMMFGWYRAEVLGALTSVLMIWVVTGILFYIAIERIINMNFEIEADIMLLTSIVGVVVNIAMVLVLHQHHHHHGPSKSSTGGEDGHKREDNINVRAAMIHVIGDFIQSFGVLLASLIIFYKPDWKIMDPICTFLFSILVLITTFAILRDTMIVLMEGMPKGVDFADVLSTFLSIDGVVKVHNLRIWALSLDKTALAAHLAIKPGVSSTKILKIASRKIHNKFDVFEMTLQIEEFQEEMENCEQCKQPIA